MFYILATSKRKACVQIHTINTRIWKYS